VGLVAAIDLASRPDAVGARAYEAMDRAFREQDLMVRITGDTLALTPPLIISEAQIGELADKLARLLRTLH
jgi:beta-alanine--pyruvate transaminase